MDEMIKLVKSKIDIDEEIIEDAISTYEYTFQSLYDSGVDISEFFEKKGNGIGIKESFFEYLIATSDDFGILVISCTEDWKKYTSSKKLEKYFYLFEKYNIRLKNFDEINKYVEEFEDGYKPTIELYDKALFDFQSFKALFSDDDWKNNYKPGLEVEQYIEFIITYGFKFEFLIKTKEDIKLYFNENGLNPDLYDKALFDSQLFEVVFIDDKWKNNYKPGLEVEQYIEYVKKYGFIFYNYIKTKEDINFYFKNGTTEKVYEEALFDKRLFSIFFLEKEWKNNYNPGSEVEQYIEFVIAYGFKFRFLIKTKEDINKYFKNGTTEKVYEEALFNSRLFEIIFSNEKYKNNYKPGPEVEQYLKYKKKYGFIFYDYIKSLKDIRECFDAYGPLPKFYEKALFDSQVFEFIFSGNEWKKHYKPELEVEQYIEFIKKYGFILENFCTEKEEIGEYFDSNGLMLNNKFIENLLFNSDIDLNNYVSFNDKFIEIGAINQLLENLSDDIKSRIMQFFKEESINYNIFVILNLVKNLDVDLEDKKINMEIPNVCKLLNMYNNEELVQICKYILYSDDNNFYKLSYIIKEGKLEQFQRIYYFLFKKWDIKNYKKFIDNFYNNMELCDNLEMLLKQYKKPTDEQIYILEKILIFGDKSAIGVVKTIEDLEHYKELVYDVNLKIIESSSDIIEVKRKIFNLLFNGNSFFDELKRFDYESDRLNSLINSINNPLLKELVKDIKLILEFIESIDKEKDIDILKKYLKILNESFKRNNEIFTRLQESVKNIDDELKCIRGLEINEKITILNELIENHLDNNVPLSKDGRQPLYDVSSCTVLSDFEYDNVFIKKGTSVPIIELKGYPFVMMAHVLNAYGSGGRLSYFNHPLLIGRTHICLSAIDDNFHEVVGWRIPSIENVCILFDKLPENNFFISSEQDVVSRTQDNSLDITSEILGNYLSVRDNVTKTYYSVDGHNEYVYYREGMRPSGILVSGEEPNEYEIQAAAYLNVPLVKINEKYYPRLTEEQMMERDEELKEFYAELYKQRRMNENQKERDKLVNLRDNLVAFINYLNHSEDIEHVSNFNKKGK